MVGVVCPSIVYFFDINIYHLTETSSWIHHLLKAQVQRWSLADTEAANQIICFGNTRAWKLSTQDFQLRCSAITLVLHHWSNLINSLSPPPIWLGATAGKEWWSSFPGSYSNACLSRQTTLTSTHPYCSRYSSKWRWKQLPLMPMNWQEGIIDTRLYLFSSSTGCQLLHNITYLHSGTQNVQGMSTLKYSSPYGGWDSTRQMHKS